MVDHGESMDDGQPTVPATDNGSVILAEGQDLSVSTVQQELAATGGSHMRMPSAQPRTSPAATTDGMVYASSLVCIFLWTDIFYAHYSRRRS